MLCFNKIKLSYNGLFINFIKCQILTTFFMYIFIGSLFIKLMREDEIDRKYFYVERFFNSTIKKCLICLTMRPMELTHTDTYTSRQEAPCLAS